MSEGGRRGNVGHAAFTRDKVGRAARRRANMVVKNGRESGERVMKDKGEKEG